MSMVDDPRQQSRQRRGGMFGSGRARGILRREDGDPGTLVNYALFGRNGVEDMRTSPMRRDLFGRQIAALDREAASSKTQQQQMEQAIATLPPEQQAWARLNPQAFVRAMAEAQMDNNNGWNVGQGYSHAFRVNPDGTLQQGAPLPLRPRAPIMGYVMPSDTQDWEYGDD